MHRWSQLRLAGRTALLATGLVVGLSACSMQLGKPLSGMRVAEVLQPQVTTMDAVQRALEAPQGRGRGYLPGAGPVEVWEYHYVTASAGGEAQQQQLLIFFDGQRVVQGYVWYSTAN